MRTKIIKTLTFIFAFSLIFLGSVKAASNITNKDEIEVTDVQGNVDILCNISDNDTTLTDYHDNYDEIGYIGINVGETRNIKIEFGMSAYYIGRSVSLFFTDDTVSNTFFSSSITTGANVSLFNSKYDLGYIGVYDYDIEEAHYAEGKEIIYSLEGLTEGIYDLKFTYQSGNSGDSFAVSKIIPVIVYASAEENKTIPEVNVSITPSVTSSLSDLATTGLSFYYPDSIHYDIGFIFSKFMNDTITEKFVYSSLDTSIINVDQAISIASTDGSEIWGADFPITLKGKKGSTMINIKRFIGDYLVEDVSIPIYVYDTSAASVELKATGNTYGLTELTGTVDFEGHNDKMNNISYEWYVNDTLEKTTTTNTYTFEAMLLSNADVVNIKVLIKDSNTCLRYLSSIPDKELTTAFTSVIVEDIQFYYGNKVYVAATSGVGKYKLVGDLEEVSMEYLELLKADVVLDSSATEGIRYSVDLESDGYYFNFESKIVGDYYFIVKITLPNGSVVSSQIEVVVISEEEVWVPETSTAFIYLDESDTAYIRIGYMRNGLFSALTTEPYILVSTNNTNIIPSIGMKDGELTISLVANNIECEGYIYAVSGEGEGSYTSNAFSISVKVQETRSNTTTSYFDFEEGTKISMFLTNTNDVETTISIGGIIANLGLSFSWFCVGDDILRIEKISDYQVRVIPKTVGTTKVIAAHTTSTGRTITGSIDVEIIEDIPTVSIEVTKAKDVTSLTSLSIYDILQIKLNANGFKFSNQTTYSWYLDGEKINNVLNDMDIIMAIGNTQSFRYKLSESGTHTIKVSITDAGYGFTLDEEQEISISEIENVQMQFGLSHTDTIYALLEGQEFSVDALLDGVVNKAYSYTWYISSPTVLEFLYNTNTSATAIVKPKSVGSTKLTVQCDIGRYGINNIVSAEVIIIVEKFEKIEVVSKSDYIKPGEQGIFDVKINNKTTYINTEIDAEVYLDNEKIEDFKIENNRITVDNLSSGKCSVKASFGKYNDSAKVDVTNFNLKIFVKNVVPYLFIAVLFVLVIAFIVKRRKTNLEKLDIKLKKLQEKTKFYVEKITNETKNTKPIIRRIQRRCKRICNDCEYTIDTGIDELKNVLQLLVTCDNILIATIKVTNKETKPSRNKLILKNLLNRNFVEIYSLFIEIYESREQFKKNIIAQGQENTIIKKKEKKKMTPEEYQNYLQSYVIEEDDADD